VASLASSVGKGQGKGIAAATLRRGLLVTGVVLTSGTAVVLCAPSKRTPPEEDHHVHPPAVQQHLKHSEKDEDGNWRAWLPQKMQPSTSEHKANMANVQPPALSSIEAALPSMVDTGAHGHQAHAGIEVANRDAVAQQILRLDTPGAAQMLAHDARHNLPIENAILTKAPFCPPPITRDYPVLLRVGLETTAKVMQCT